MEFGLTEVLSSASRSKGGHGSEQDYAQLGMMLQSYIKYTLLNQITWLSRWASVHFILSQLCAFITISHTSL